MATTNYRDENGRYTGNGSPVTQSDIKRLDELREAEIRRVNDLFDAQETSEAADQKITRREADQRWANHEKSHEHLTNAIDLAKNSTNAALKAALDDHHREHIVHEESHAREHIFTKNALDKAEISMDKRLEGMNEFRAQLQGQAATFVSKDQFDVFAKERNQKLEDVQINLTNRYDAAIKTVTEKYEQGFKSVLANHDSDVTSLRTEIQNERELRKVFEGSVSTWKWIASFLGVSGVAGVVALFITRSQG